MHRNVLIASVAASAARHLLTLPPDQETEVPGGAHLWLEGKSAPFTDPFTAKDDLHYAEGVQLLGEFARANPHAPTEALFRVAQANDLHEAGPDDWEIQPHEQYAAYQIFRAVLDTLDKADAVTKARLEEADRAQAAAAGPLAASAHSVDVRDTIMELQPDPLELNPGMVLKRMDGDAVSGAAQRSSTGDPSTDQADGAAAPGLEGGADDAPAPAAKPDPAASEPAETTAEGVTEAPAPAKAKRAKKSA